MDAGRRWRGGEELRVRGRAASCWGNGVSLGVCLSGGSVVGHAEGEGGEKGVVMEKGAAEDRGYGRACWCSSSWCGHLVEFVVQ